MLYLIRYTSANVFFKWIYSFSEEFWTFRMNWFWRHIVINYCFEFNRLILKRWLLIKRSKAISSIYSDELRFNFVQTQREILCIEEDKAYVCRYLHVFNRRSILITTKMHICTIIRFVYSIRSKIKLFPFSHSTEQKWNILWKNCISYIVYISKMNVNFFAKWKVSMLLLHEIQKCLIPKFSCAATSDYLNLKKTKEK